jgi:hypothetical protein
MTQNSRTTKGEQVSHTTKGCGQYPTLTLAQLERVNAQLASHDYAVMEEDSGRPTLWRIKRGGATVPGHSQPYDRFVRVNSRSKLPAAVAALWQSLWQQTR